MPPRLNRLSEARAWHRFVDFLHAVKLRHYDVICHPQDKPWFADAIAQVLEDPETWPWGDAPTLYAHVRVPRSECFAFDEKKGAVLTMDKVVNSKRGFGRFGGFRIPDPEQDHDPMRVNRG